MIHRDARGCVVTAIRDSRRVLSGPRPPLDADRQERAARYIPLARKLAWMLEAKFPGEADEFESAAMLGLVQAAGSFDPGRVSISRLATLRINGALRDELRRMGL